MLLTEAPHKPGMLRRMTETLAQGDIDIHHLYATATMTQERSLVVFATTNNDRAMVLLNASATERRRVGRSRNAQRLASRDDSDEG